MMWHSQNNKVTIELHQLLKDGFVLFDFDYPIWSESHREELELKIVNHYAFRQIGQETPARFKHYFQTKMLEIMPKYVRLYTTTQFKYNPIENYNMIENSEDTTAGSNTSTRNSSNVMEDITRVSDTPQGSIDNIDDYISQASKHNNNNTADETFKGSDTTKQDHTLTRKGNIGVTTTQQMIEQERKILEFDLDLAIIGELASLFLGVY